MKPKTPAHLVQKLFDKANVAATKLVETKSQETLIVVVSRYAQLLFCCRQHHFLTETDPRWEILNRKMPQDIRLAVKRSAWKVYEAEFPDTLRRTVGMTYNTATPEGMETFLKGLEGRLVAPEGQPAVVHGEGAAK